jgi:hypothetical protein
MVSHIVMRTPSVRNALLEALLLALAGCAPSPYKRGGNPRGLSQRDVERDYMECTYKARLANEQHFYSQSSPSPFGPGPQSPSDHARALHGISSINAIGIPAWQPRDLEWNGHLPTLPPCEDNKDPRNVHHLGIARSRSIQHAHPSD